MLMLPCILRISLIEPIRVILEFLFILRFASFNCRLEEPILEILYGAKTIFTLSAITPPKVNRFR